VQDLNGLDSNILNALRDCSRLITVLHPRGNIARPDGSTQTRASVWIEQEIAIATYIQRAEKRSLPVIAFIHKSVGREGIMDLLHLNPIPFTEEAEILGALPELLRDWKNIGPSSVRVAIEAIERHLEDGHRIRKMLVTVINDTNNRFADFNAQLRIPSGLLKHWSTTYSGEVASADPRHRCFSVDEVGRGAISPHSSKLLYSVVFCTECAAKDTGEGSAIAFDLVAQSRIEAKVWLDGREYSSGITIEELEKDATAKGH
jgi:hypothetical protein